MKLDHFGSGAQARAAFGPAPEGRYLAHNAHPSRSYCGPLEIAVSYERGTPAVVHGTPVTLKEAELPTEPVQRQICRSINFRLESSEEEEIDHATGEPRSWGNATPF